MEEISFGEWLTRQRKILGLTQQKLAKQINCATITIRKIEAQQRRPSLQVAEQLARTLLIPPGEREAFLRYARGYGQTGAVTRPESYPWHPSSGTSKLIPAPFLGSVPVSGDRLSMLADELLGSISELYRKAEVAFETNSRMTLPGSQAVVSYPPEEVHKQMLVMMKIMDQAVQSVIRILEYSMANGKSNPTETGTPIDLQAMLEAAILVPSTAHQ